MSNPELLEWVGSVLKSTLAGNIEWRALNPTTYSWEQPGPNAARVILQRIERLENYQASQGRVAQRKVTQFLLQVFQISKGATPIVTLNGAEDAESNAYLEKLFGVITNASMKENLDFLKSLLPRDPGSASSR